MGGAERKSHNIERGDNDVLAGVEANAVSEIEAALRGQLEMVRRARGGRSVDAIIEAVMAGWARDDTLVVALRGLLLASAEEGLQMVGRHLPFEPGVGIDWTLANTAVSEWVEDYGFDLVTGINETSADRLRRVMRRWIDEGGTLDELADDIRPIFADDVATAQIEAIFKVDRAHLIASTEATRAYAHGKVQGYLASGLAEVGPVVMPPDDSHVGCRCDVGLEKRDGVWHWVWYTARDDRVCPVCAPLHLQSVGVAKAAKVEVSDG